MLWGPTIRLAVAVGAVVALVVLWLTSGAAFLIAAVRLRLITAAVALAVWGAATWLIHHTSEIDFDSWVYFGRLRKYPDDDDPPLFI